ncbi:hypothetical protein QR680_006916 [Steinernema hermaphroditum]|uniref:Peptidase S26 domain-containing protein n=1 Tax=Steinernema hermaphroditum TaxID=289476 RepID=A0AA39HZ61_9BILA|nr:hypothetical protein QR680_006916 [Steinernema hermaphroditum]
MSGFLRQIVAVSACAGLTAFGFNRTSTTYRELEAEFEDRQLEAQFPELKKEFEWARQNTPWPGSRYAVFDAVYRVCKCTLFGSKESSIEKIREIFADQFSEEDAQKLGNLFWYVTLHQSPALECCGSIGLSMSPTLQNFGLGIYRRFVNPQQEVLVGDIVTYRIPYDWRYADCRVVAIGPATVYNDLKRREEHVPEGKVYLMGDNRKDSYDSRHYGSIKLNALRSKLVAVYQPSFKNDFTLVKEQPPQPKPQPQQSFGKTLLNCGACVLFLCALCHSSD